MLLYPSFTDILSQNTLVHFLYTSDFITMNPIDLSCKVTSTTSNEVIPPQTTEVTSTTSNEASSPYSSHYHQTGINTNLTGLRLKQPKVYLCHKLITVPSGLNLQIPKVHLWDYTISPDQNFNRNFVPVNTPISSTSMQELNICTHCWQPVTGNVMMHKIVKHFAYMQ